MPPRHAYWTIIFGNQPTSFRTATQDELLPTFKQIQSKHPDAVMMWFAHGRLWRSPEEAREVRFRKRQHRGEGRESRGPKPQWRDRQPAPPPVPPERRSREGGKPPSGERGPTADRRPPTADRRPFRGRDWRPGGNHTDPRDRFKVPRDVKRARFKAQLRRDRTNPKREGGPVPPKRQGREGGERQRREGGPHNKKKDGE